MHIGHVQLHYEDNTKYRKNHHLMHTMEEENRLGTFRLYSFSVNRFYSFSSFNIYFVQISLIRNNSWSQQSRFSWIFLTIFVKRFLAGLNDATISSICWILQIHEKIKCCFKEFCVFLAAGAHKLCNTAYIFPAITSSCYFNTSAPSTQSTASFILDHTYVVLPIMFLKLCTWRT